MGHRRGCGDATPSDQVTPTLVVMTVILLRHGRSTANTSQTLAGRSPGVGLDEQGDQQARSLVGRMAGLPIAAVVTSPLQRCRQTVEHLADALALTPIVDERLIEVNYGDWTGRRLEELVKEPLWRVVQQHPSAVVFPGGEGLAQVQARAVAAVREHDARLRAEHDADTLWVACSHGDVIKAVLADAFGTHLDGFQRIVAAPSSVSVVRYTETRPFVLHMNDTGSDLSGLAPAHNGARVETEADGAARGSDAVIGGAV